MDKDTIKLGIALKIAHNTNEILLSNLAELEFQMQEMKQELDALKAKPVAADTPAQ